MKKTYNGRVLMEKGEIMLESTFILVAVIILLLVLLSISFMFYQQSVMTSVARAIENGYDSEAVREKLLVAKYAFKLRRSEFAEIRQSVGDLFTVTRNMESNLYSARDGYVFPSSYEYVGPVNVAGVVIVSGDDSRLVTKDGMVLGIFKGKVSGAGLYSEGLIPACVDGKYGYLKSLIRDDMKK